MSSFEIIEKEFVYVLEQEYKVSMLKMATVMGKAFQEILDHIEEKKGKMIEAPYCRYVDVDWEKAVNSKGLKSIISKFTKKWHFFCGIVTEAKSSEYHMMKSRTLPKRKYVTAVHHGPYQNVGKIYAEMYNWLKSEGYTALPESLEFYTNDPSEVTKEELETIIYIPLEG